MKYHKKARQFCEEKIFKNNNEIKQRLQDTVMNTIKDADKANISLKKLLENFGEEYGSKEPKEAIAFLEILYEYFASQELYDCFDASKNFGYDFKMNDRRVLFNQVFNSMVKTANDKNNQDLLEYLKTYTTLIKCHDKAKALYELKDRKGKYCSCIINRIIQAAEEKTDIQAAEEKTDIQAAEEKTDIQAAEENMDIQSGEEKKECAMKFLMLEIGCDLVEEDPKTAIVFLEATYEALKIQKDFIEEHKLNLDENGEPLSIDALFSQAFYILYEIAQFRPLSHKGILKALEEYYPGY